MSLYLQLWRLAALLLGGYVIMLLNGATLYDVYADLGRFVATLLVLAVVVPALIWGGNFVRSWRDGLRAAANARPKSALDLSDPDDARHEKRAALLFA